MSYKPRIKLIVVTEDSITETEIKAPHVTATMYAATHELIYTMSTGKLCPRGKPKHKKTARKMRRRAKQL